MRLATPGAILMFAGILILWWGLGIVRGEVGSSGTVRQIVGPFPKPSSNDRKAGGAGGGAQIR